MRAIHRYYKPRIAQSKGDEREYLDHEYMEHQASIEEELEGIHTRRLVRLAWRYYIVPPDTPWGERDEGQDENWTYGGMSGTWYLKPTAVASLRRQIEEAKKRRLEVWEARAKILGGLMPWLVALVSAFASLILAGRR